MKRALLISGGVNQGLNHAWYANDLATYYGLLSRTYGYAPGDVRVCAGAGGALPLLGGDLVPVRSARRDQVLAALGWLAELGEGDQAFLMVTDHGGPEGISLWGKGQFLSPAQLAQILGGSAATKVLALGQCHSGCFGGLPPGRAVICCACGENGLSYPVPRPAPGVEPPYSEFLYQLAGALEGHYPDGSPLDGERLAPPPPDRISIGAAFRYARDHDRWITGTRAVNELPRIFDPAGIADSLTL
jgi:hypothetical protein